MHHQSPIYKNHAQSLIDIVHGLWTHDRAGASCNMTRCRYQVAPSILTDFEQIIHTNKSTLKYFTTSLANLSNRPKQCLKHPLEIASKIAPNIVPKIALRNAKKKNSPNTSPKKLFLNSPKYNVFLFRVIQKLSFVA